MLGTCWKTSPMPIEAAMVPGDPATRPGPTTRPGVTAQPGTATHPGVTGEIGRAHV